MSFLCGVLTVAGAHHAVILSKLLACSMLASSKATGETEPGNKHFAVLFSCAYHLPFVCCP